VTPVSKIVHNSRLSFVGIRNIPAAKVEEDKKTENQNNQDGVLVAVTRSGIRK
jgi:hypothetical protein